MLISCGNLKQVFICDEPQLCTRLQLNQHISMGDSEVDGSESECGGFMGHPCVSSVGTHIMEIKVCGTGTDGRIGQPTVWFDMPPFHSKSRRTDEGKQSRTGEEKREK